MKLTLWWKTRNKTLKMILHQKFKVDIFMQNAIRFASKVNEKSFNLFISHYMQFTKS